MAEDLKKKQEELLNEEQLDEVTGGNGAFPDLICHY